MLPVVQLDGVVLVLDGTTKDEDERRPTAVDGSPTVTARISLFHHLLFSCFLFFIFISIFNVNLFEYCTVLLANLASLQSTAAHPVQDGTKAVRPVQGGDSLVLCRPHAVLAGQDDRERWEKVSTTELPS